MICETLALQVSLGMTVLPGQLMVACPGNKIAGVRAVVDEDERVTLGQLEKARRVPSESMSTVPLENT